LYLKNVGSRQPPPELLTYLLCKEIYHCTPSQLKQERVVDVMPHLTIFSEIAVQQR